MKRYLLILLLVFFSGAAAFARVNNLVAFCNDGEKFTLILNGQRYNEVPATTVRAEGLILAKYEAKIIFENKKIRDTETTITFFNDGYECVFSLDGNGRKYKLNYLSSSKINPTEEPAPVDNSNTYNNSTNTNSTETYTTNSNSNTNTNPTNTTTYSSTNTTSSNTTNSTNSNSMSVTTNGVDVGMNENGSVKLGTPLGNINMNTSDKSGNLNIGNGVNAIHLNKAPAKTGCATAMTLAQFETLKQTVSSQTTDTTKITAAHALLENNCFLVSQVKEVTKLLPNDKAKLDFAKKAYSHTNDISNYGQLKDAFSTEESKKQLTTFIKEQK